MKRLSFLPAMLLVFFTAMLSSCQAIGDIFKAGVWVGVLAVGLVVFLIIYFIAKSKK